MSFHKTEKTSPCKPAGEGRGGGAGGRAGERAGGRAGGRVGGRESEGERTRGQEGGREDAPLAKILVLSPRPKRPTRPSAAMMRRTASG
jgi:hypothetical protein